MKNSKNNTKLNSWIKQNEETTINEIWGSIPEFSVDEKFKKDLENKLKDKIEITKRQVWEQKLLNSIPKKLKRRFYLTWYWYAVCTFLVLFLIWFCTNIFTWTINIPVKYKFLAQDEAFWDINNLLNNSNISINKDETINDIPNNNKILNAYNYQISRKALSKKWKINTAVNYLNSNSSWVNDIDILLDDWFAYNKTYNFIYKDKKFPKLKDKYPVYKSNWVLISSNTQDQFLKKLKIWDVSFWRFQNLEIKNFTIDQKKNQWYSISFNKDSQSLNFYPNNNRQAKIYTWSLPSNKNIIKNVEKNLKILWISLKNYWNWTVLTENFDENMWIIHVFYPFLIQWKNVRDPNKNEQLWINIAYDLNNKKLISITWIDITSYDVSDYPTTEKNTLESAINEWWSYFKQWSIHNNSTKVLLDTLELIYIKKATGDWKILFIPAIKWSVSIPLSNYNWPIYIFKEII